jgi:hypothetical protein
LYSSWFSKRFCQNDSSRRRIPSHSIGEHKIQQSKRFAYLHRTTIPSLSFSVDNLAKDSKTKQFNVNCEKSNSTLNSFIQNESSNANIVGRLFSKLSKSSDDCSFKSIQSDDVFS